MGQSRREVLSGARAKAVLLDHVCSAAAVLQRQKPPGDEAVHEARKRLKRARASLRLLRVVIGDEAYRRENVALRDAARPLSPARDAAVMEQALAGIVKETPAAQWAAPLRQQFVEKRRDARRYGLDRIAIGRIVEALEGSAARIAAWDVEAAACERLRDAIERLYRKGRKALAHAVKESSAESLHEARKQVKYLELALEPFLQESKDSDRKDRLSRIVDKAEAIEEDLGQDHDLAVLRTQAAALLGAREAEGKPLFSAIESRQQRLRAKALKRARKFYKKKPARFRAKVTRELVPDDSTSGSG
jgi:CHAD domain-containing protein